MSERAFPLNGRELPNGDYQYTEFGMTLRDYFAQAASEEEIEYQKPMIGAVEKIVNDGVGGNKRIVWGRPDNWRQIARYMHADAMLEARKK